MPPHKGVIGEHCTWFGGVVELPASYWYTTLRPKGVAQMDQRGVCCREGIASGIGLLWNPWRGRPKAYRIFVAMPALPELKCAPVK
jgi:hypothetical protein